MGKQLNFELLYEVNTTPEAGAGSETWKRIGAGITSADPSPNEVLDQTTYLDGDGDGETDVTGGQLVYAFAGHREGDDEAQNYVASKVGKYGEARKTTFRMTDSYGNKKEGACSLANIVDGGGDAASKSTFSFEVHLNGKPTFTIKQAAEDLGAVIAAGVTSGTTTFTATVTAPNKLGYSLTAASIGPVYGGQYVPDYNDYTSGDEIEAVEGQYLNMYEFDAYNHVVKFSEHLLIAADIAV